MNIFEDENIYENFDVRKLPENIANKLDEVIDNMKKNISHSHSIVNEERKKTNKQINLFNEQINNKQREINELEEQIINIVMKALQDENSEYKQINDKTKELQYGLSEINIGSLPEKDAKESLTKYWNSMYKNTKHIPEAITDLKEKMKKLTNGKNKYMTNTVNEFNKEMDILKKESEESISIFKQIARKSEFADGMISKEFIDFFKNAEKELYSAKYVKVSDYSWWCKKYKDLNDALFKTNSKKNAEKDAYNKLNYEELKNIIKKGAEVVLTFDDNLDDLLAEIEQKADKGHFIEKNRNYLRKLALKFFNENGEPVGFENNKVKIYNNYNDVKNFIEDSHEFAKIVYNGLLALDRNTLLEEILELEEQWEKIKPGTQNIYKQIRNIFENIKENILPTNDILQYIAASDLLTIYGSYLPQEYINEIIPLNKSIMEHEQSLNILEDQLNYEKSRARILTEQMKAIDINDSYVRTAINIMDRSKNNEIDGKINEYVEHEIKSITDEINQRKKHMEKTIKDLEKEYKQYENYLNDIEIELTGQYVYPDNYIETARIKQDLITKLNTTKYEIDHQKRALEQEEDFKMYMFGILEKIQSIPKIIAGEYVPNQSSGHYSNHQYSNQTSNHTALTQENKNPTNMIITIILAIIAFFALCAVAAIGARMKGDEKNKKKLAGLIISCCVLISAGSGAIYCGTQLKDSDDE